MTREVELEAQIVKLRELIKQLKWVEWSEFGGVGHYELRNVTPESIAMTVSAPPHTALAQLLGPTIELLRKVADPNPFFKSDDVYKELSRLLSIVKGEA